MKMTMYNYWVDKWWANTMPVMKTARCLVDKWWANMMAVMKTDNCWLAVMKTVGCWLDKCWVMIPVTKLAS
jgi:hypothetical protein